MAEEQGGPGGGGNPIVVVKKKKRGGGHGHHGGAWKVAYADFVTAMMAFFLLLWLLASTSQEQKQGIAHYFNPPNNSTQYGGGEGILGGQSAVESPEHAPQESPDFPQADEEQMALQAGEDASFQRLSDAIKQKVKSIPELAALMENLMVDITPEGLRIQLVDREGRPLFVDRSANLMPQTERMLAVIANVLGTLPNQIAVGAYTDAVPFRGENPAYTNWELSADRAQVSRKVLMREGIVERRIARVAGYAAQELLYRDAPGDIRNNRISLIALRATRSPIRKFTENGLIMPQAGDMY